MRKDMTVEYGESFIRVGKPVVDAFIKASGTSVVLPCVPVDGYVLISFEVNGTVIARRELFEMVEGSVTVGDYTIAYESGVVTISTTSSNDIVDIRIEPVDVVISDAFRAAVNETAPQTPNELPDVGSSDKGKYLHTNESTGALEWAEGGSGGGDILIANIVLEGFPPTLSCDMSSSEIISAITNGKTVLACTPDGLLSAFHQNGDAAETANVCVVSTYDSKLINVVYTVSGYSVTQTQNKYNLTSAS